MSIGNKLREAREKKQLTIKQAYEKTRIYPDILTALEQDEYKKILNPTYIRSFLKEYASFLGLNSAEILEEYNKLKTPKPKKTASPQQKPAEKLEGLGPFFKRIRKAYPLGLDPSFKRNRKVYPLGLETIKSLSKIVTLIVKWAVFTVLAVIVLLGLIRFVGNSIKSIKNRPVVKQAQEKQQKTKPQAEVVKKKTPPRQTRVVEKPSKGIVIPQDKELILTINAIDNAWFQLKVDGKIIFENMLKKGTSDVWKAKENFTISTKKANVLQINLNGNNLGLAGKGAVKNLVIDREGIKR